MPSRVLAQPARPARRSPTANGSSPVPAGRRRRVDPTTCERHYHSEEVEFMQAVERYKRLSGRMFPTCSELLEVVRSLGYVRPAGLPAGVVAGHG